MQLRHQTDSLHSYPQASAPTAYTTMSTLPGNAGGTSAACPPPALPPALRCAPHKTNSLVAESLPSLCPRPLPLPPARRPLPAARRYLPPAARRYPQLSSGPLASCPP